MAKVKVLTEHGHMNAIDVRYQQQWGKHEQKVAKKNIGAPQQQFNDLHNEVVSQLWHHMCAKTTAIPMACPPCVVYLVMLEFTRQEHSNQELVYRTLDMDDCDETQHRIWCIPQLISQERNISTQHVEKIQPWKRKEKDAQGTQRSHPFPPKWIRAQWTRR